MKKWSDIFIYETDPETGQTMKRRLTTTQKREYNRCKWKITYEKESDLEIRERTQIEDRLKRLNAIKEVKKAINRVKMRKNKANKKVLIEQDKHKEYGAESYRLWIKTGGNFWKRDELLDQEFPGDDGYSLKCIQKARQEQVKKVKDQIEFYKARGYIIYFITFTIKESKFEKYQLERYTVEIEKAIRREVIKAMKDFDDYSVNIDFGFLYGRLHFHAIGFKKPETIKIEGLGPETVELGFDKSWTEEHKKTKWDEQDKKWKTIKVVSPNSEPLIKYAKNIGNVVVQKTRASTENICARYLGKITTHSVKIKQRYISTKKGSVYQQYKKNRQTLRRSHREGIDVNTLPAEVWRIIDPERYERIRAEQREWEKFKSEYKVGC